MIDYYDDARTCDGCDRPMAFVDHVVHGYCLSCVSYDEYEEYVEILDTRNCIKHRGKSKTSIAPESARNSDTSGEDSVDSYDPENLPEGVQIVTVEV